MGVAENGFAASPIEEEKRGGGVYADAAAQKRERVLKYALVAGGVFFVLAILVYHYRGTITYNLPLPAHGDASVPAIPLDYSTVAGYFKQDDARTQEWVFDFHQENFGLITDQFSGDGSQAPWQRFARWVDKMNGDATDGESFRVLFIGRAVESKHNVASGKYGSTDFDNFKSKHPGDAQFNWTDPQITVRGRVQTEVNHGFMSTQLTQQKMPAPQSYYVSPLARTLDTAEKIFGGLDLPFDRQFRPIVKEDLRETHGVRMCDKRSSATWIREHFPGFTLEQGFPFDDERWNPDLRETEEEHTARTQRFLDAIFASDPNTWISLTCHAGTSKTLMTVLNHRPWPLKMGEIVPVLVRARPHREEEQEGRSSENTKS